MKHVVDQLIEERAERLMQHPRLWALLKRLVYPILSYKQAIKSVNTVRDMSGVDVMSWVSDQLKLKVDVTGLENIPSQGAAIVVANHPAGIADGIAMWDAVTQRRNDVRFFANRDAIRAAPGLEDVIIPVEWVDERRTRERSKETVKQMVQAFRQQNLVVIFPSGRLAQPTVKGLVEGPWMPTALGLAQKYQCPIVPIHVSGRNSWLYYLFYMIHTELRDMTIFRELLNKTGYRYQLTVGNAVAPEHFANLDSKLMADAMRQFVAEEMPKGERTFDTQSLPPAVNSNGE